MVVVAATAAFELGWEHAPFGCEDGEEDALATAAAAAAVAAATKVLIS